MTTALHTERSELGDFSSIVCLKAIITGIEDALGEKATAIALLAAGRARGRQLAQQLGLSNTDYDLNTLTIKVADALGKNGTRLLLLHKVERDGDLFRVYTSETVCSSGEVQGSNRRCSFTLGAVQGVLETVTGLKLRGTQIGSVLSDGEYDVFEYGPVLR